MMDNRGKSPINCLDLTNLCTQCTKWCQVSKIDFKFAACAYLDFEKKLLNQHPFVMPLTCKSVHLSLSPSLLPLKEVIFISELKLSNLMVSLIDNSPTKLAIFEQFNVQIG